MKDVDYTILKNGFNVHQNKFSKFWFCNSVDCNEEGDYQFCFKDLKYQAVELRDLLNGLLTDFSPIIEICKKYDIPLKDLPSTLEEYIALDNGEEL